MRGIVVDVDGGEDDVGYAGAFLEEGEERDVFLGWGPCVMGLVVDDDAGMSLSFCGGDFTQTRTALGGTGIVPWQGRLRVWCLVLSGSHVMQRYVFLSPTNTDVAGLDTMSAQWLQCACNLGRERISTQTAMLPCKWARYVCIG